MLGCVFVQLLVKVCNPRTGLSSGWVDLQRSDDQEEGTAQGKSERLTSEYPD
jgi:hypothetical protein